MSLQGLSVIESGLATTKSENAGELPTYLVWKGISQPGLFCFPSFSIMPILFPIFQYNAYSVPAYLLSI
jgi:hypothetical protein